MWSCILVNTQFNIWTVFPAREIERKEFKSEIILLEVIVVVIKKLLTKLYWSTAPRAKQADLGLPLCLALPPSDYPLVSSPELNKLFFLFVFFAQFKAGQ